MAEVAGDLLRRARVIAGLSQSELARRARVSQPVISAYETGRREPGLAMLTKLIEVTGCALTIDVRPGRNEPPGCLTATPVGRQLRRRRRAVLETAARRGAHHLRVFGSVARGDDSADSDIDLLVDLDEGVSLVGLIGLERELAELLGRRVDVVPARNLKTELATRVLAEAVQL